MKKSITLVGLPGCIGAIFGIAISTTLTLYVVFWLFGVWIPWYIAMFGSFISPAIFLLWFVLLVLHFASIHFPLFP